MAYHSIFLIVLCPKGPCVHKTNTQRYKTCGCYVSPSRNKIKLNKQLLLFLLEHPGDHHVEKGNNKKQIEIYEDKWKQR